jgi:VCBS repeat protein/tetratricopeptide repeat protein
LAVVLALGAARVVFVRAGGPTPQGAKNPRAGKGRRVLRSGSASTQRHRNLGKAYYEQGKYTEAAEEFRKVIAAGQALATDHLNLGIALLQNNENDKALGELTTARQMGPGLVAADYNLGILYKRELRYPDAEAALGRVIHTDPNDPAAWFNLGDVYQAERKLPESLTAFQHVDEMGFGRGQNFYVASLFHTFTILVRMKRQQEAKRYLDLHEKLRDKVPSISVQNPALEGGRYGAILVPIAVPAGASAAAPMKVAWTDITSKLGLSPASTASQGPPNSAIASVAQWATSVAIGDYDGDGRADLYVVSPAGTNRLFHHNQDGTFTDVTEKAGVAGPGGSISAAFADYDNSGHASLFVAGVGGVRLYKNHGDGTFSDETEKAGLKMPSGLAATQALLFDADNDGFLDLVVTVYGDLDRLPITGAKGAAGFPEGLTPVASFFFRNNGDGTFTDATTSSGLASAQGRMRGALFADFNNDGYADLLFFRDDGPPRLFLNRGEDKFLERTREAGPALAGSTALDARAADFNHDGNFDLILWTKDDYRVLLNRGNAQFTPVRDLPHVTPPGGLFDSHGTVADVDGDGFDDILNLDADGKLHFLRNVGGGFADQSGEFAAGSVQAGLTRVTPAWLEDPGRLDLIAFSRTGELAILEKQGPPAHWLEVKLDGSKSNTQGVGAVVELKAGNFYSKVLATGGPLRAYTGALSELDVVRVTWPNAIVQNSIHVATDKPLNVRESERLASSCPFLYVWDGTKFVYLTDVLGAAPIGELAPDGTTISPHPEEYVRLPANLGAQDGDYVFQLTDEMREVDYFDQLRLVAVDHPATEEVYSDEIYSWAPAAPTLYAVGEKHFPVSATDEHGRDVLALVREQDGRYPADFRHSRILGVADLHSLTLDLGAFPRAAHISLWLKGWVFWTDSNASRALESNKSLSMVPPYLQVPDADGGWVTVIPDMGLPSGTNRTMRVDLTGKFLSEDHRVRIVTNLCAFWDQVFFTLDARPVAPTAELPLAGADLHYRGFSKPGSDPLHLRPDSFEYEDVLADAPWNPMAGRYTRYGPVGELLKGEDDRLVVMAAGDELTVRFSGKNLPPIKAGWKRTFFLYTAGYAKDGEPNTASSKTVTPLPFRGMSKYPYGPRDRYPVSPAQRLYLEHYQTRPAYLLIPPLAPPVP